MEDSWQKTDAEQRNGPCTSAKGTGAGQVSSDTSFVMTNVNQGDRRRAEEPHGRPDAPDCHKHTPGAPPVPDLLGTEALQLPCFRARHLGEDSSRSAAPSRLLWHGVTGSPCHAGAAMNPLPSSNLGVGRPSERIRHTLMHPSLPGKAKLGCMGGR